MAFEHQAAWNPAIKKLTGPIGWLPSVQVCSEVDVFEEGAGTGTGVSRRPWRGWSTGTIWGGERTWNGWKAVALEARVRQY